MEGELSEGRRWRSDTAGRFLEPRRAGAGKRRGRGPDRLKLGTFVAARHFSRQPTDMTAEAAERRAADSQDPSRSDRWRLRARPVTVGRGGEKNGGKMAEEMSADSI